MLFISTAFAADGSDKFGDFSSILANIAPLALIMLIFYFLLLRPQQKKLREHQDMLNKLAKGDKVVTTGGIFGTVMKIEQNHGVVIMEIAEGVKIRVKKDMIVELNKEGSASKAA